MDAIMVARFGPFEIFVVPGFPNLVPTMDECGEFIPRFKGDEDDHVAQHLIKFHECMDQLGISHEDLLIKMFMHSLDGDAQQLYRSLLPGDIPSLREFHHVFLNNVEHFSELNLY